MAKMAKKRPVNNRPKKNSNYNRNKKRNPGNPARPAAAENSVIVYEEGITVGELANKLNKPVAEVSKFLFLLGKLLNINSSLDDETVELVCMEYGREAQKHVEISAANFEDIVEVDNPEDLEERPPVVTIMGHVDHGKTTLLDAIRNSRIVDKEFGGITQHIGAYQVDVNGKKVTFLDTPGHEAFTAMRARGAQITDIVIIVVAADDGVMPQTKEAIDHARAAGVPIVVAINKMDKPGADPDRIMSEMSDLGLLPEAWGGDTVFIQMSARKNEGIDELLEALIVVAEMADLKANPHRPALGSVVEGRLDKGRGPVATLLIQNGTLHVGDPVVVGTAYGKVRQMLDDQGQEITAAGPSTPVEISGLNDVPSAGDKFKAFTNEKEARHIGEQRLKERQEKERRQTSAMSLEDLYAQINSGNVQDINIIVKADVQGTAEAVKASLEKITMDNIHVKVIRSTVGAISESDILLASASNAIIYGFNVRPDANVRKKAESEGVEIRLHNIIYKMVEEIEAAMRGMLTPELAEVVIGQAEIRQVIKISKVGSVAGCYVSDGVMRRDSQVRLIRDGVVIYEGQVGSLRRFQNDVREVTAGYECGMTIANYNDIKEGDIIEGFEMQEVERA